MSDQQAQAAQAQAAAAAAEQNAAANANALNTLQTPATPPTAPGPVPYDRFAEVNRDRGELAAKLKAYEDAEAERKRASMSEIDQAKADAQKWQGESSTHEQRATTAERNLDIWKAAHTAGFRHPDDAVTFLASQVGTLDSAEKVTAAVKELAEKRTDLVGSPSPQPPTRIGTLGGVTPPSTDVPVDADGKPDIKRGLGADLLAHLSGRKA